jgi:hypothetical protein
MFSLKFAASECQYSMAFFELLGNKSVETTVIHTHVMVKPGPGVRSPLDG